MPDKTPGHTAHDAYFRAKAGTSVTQPVDWGYARLHPVERQWWEAAAQAVLAQRMQMWTAHDIVQQINAREAASLEALRREAEDTP
jgi:GTP-binding protein EngB required for normal cell division